MPTHIQRDPVDDSAAFRQPVAFGIRVPGYPSPRPDITQNINLPLTASNHFRPSKFLCPRLTTKDKLYRRVRQQPWRFRFHFLCNCLHFDPSLRSMKLRSHKSRMR